MILDKQNLLSDDQAITTTASSTNVIDMGANDSKVPDTFFIGDKARLFAMVSTDFTDASTAGTATLTLSAQTSDNENFATTGTGVTTLGTCSAVGASTMEAGYVFDMPELKNIKRYIRLYATVSGTFSAGKITGGISHDRVI